MQPFNPSSLDHARLHSLDAPQAQPRRLVRQVARRRFARLQQHQTAIDVLRPLPGPGESLHVATAAAFSGWMIASAISQAQQQVLALCKELGLTPSSRRRAPPAKPAAPLADDVDALLGDG